MYKFVKENQGSKHHQPAQASGTAARQPKALLDCHLLLPLRKSSRHSGIPTYQRHDHGAQPASQLVLNPNKCMEGHAQLAARDGSVSERHSLQSPAGCEPRATSERRLVIAIASARQRDRRVPIAVVSERCVGACRLPPPPVQHAEAHVGGHCKAHQDGNRGGGALGVPVAAGACAQESTCSTLELTSCCAFVPA